MKELLNAVRRAETKAIEYIINSSVKQQLSSKQSDIVIRNVIDNMQQVVDVTAGKTIDEITSRLHKQLNNIGFKEAFEKGLITEMPNINMVESQLQSSISEIEKYSDNLKRSISVNTTKQLNNYFGILNNETLPYNQRLLIAGRDLSSRGLVGTVFASGSRTVHNSISTTLERFIRTELNNKYTKLLLEVGDAVGVTKWRVSEHANARNKGTGYKNHESWQGKDYTLDELYTVTGFGEMLGLGGINCNHTVKPVIGDVEFDYVNNDDFELVPYRDYAKQREHLVSRFLELHYV